jgi:DNA-binding transcriptional LysR family regulator
MDALRLLNFDDLFLMRLLQENTNITSIARQLNLTQPAVSQRIKKIETVFGYKLLEKAGRQLQFTTEGRSLCGRAAAALALMGDVETAATSRTINIGTRPEVGMSWLWPCMSKLKKKFPHYSYNCFFGSGEEILRLLTTGILQAVLTSAPYLIQGYGSIALAKEEYVFVAAPRIARTVNFVEDLKRHILVEHDRSFPFLRYIEPDTRASLRYKDVWFLGSTNLMVSAIIAEHGVGLVPEYLARKYLIKKRLKRVLPQISIHHDYFRLIYRLEETDAPVRELAEGLKRVGLQ